MIKIASADPEFGRVLFSSTAVYYFSAGDFAELLTIVDKRSGLVNAPARVADDFRAADSGVLVNLRHPGVTRFAPPYQLAPAPSGHLPAVVPAGSEVTTFVSTCHPNRTWSVTVNMTLDSPSADQLIALVHSAHGRPASEPILAVVNAPGAPAPWPVDRRLDSIRSAQRQISAFYGFDSRRHTVSHFRCIEVRALDSYHDAEAALATHGKALYGILTSDEGWRHVDLVTARAILDRAWGTRQFLAVLGMGDACLMLNLRPKHYSETQSRFFVDYFGQEVPYFSHEYCIACLEHGAFFAMEQCAYRKCVVDDLHAMVEQRTSKAWPDTPPLLQGVRRRNYRRSLHRALLRGMERLREMPAPELATLVGRIEAGSGLPERLDHLNQEIQAFEAEEQTNYMYRVNGLMVIIAWIGLALTLASIAIAILLAI